MEKYLSLQKIKSNTFIIGLLAFLILFTIGIHKLKPKVNSDKTTINIKLLNSFFFNTAYASHSAGEDLVNTDKKALTFKDRQEQAGRELLAELVKNEEITKERLFEGNLFEKYRNCDGLTLGELVKQGAAPSKLLKIAIMVSDHVKGFNAIVRPHYRVQPPSNIETVGFIEDNTHQHEYDHSLLGPFGRSLPRITLKTNETVKTSETAMTMEEKALKTAHDMESNTRRQNETPSSEVSFKGVPFLLKDLGVEMRGTPLAMGSRAFKDYVSEKDSEIVKRFKKAGLVIFGKTSTPEFGIMGVTEPKVWGVTTNPWNTGYSPGGSSGGSAVAVAAGIVPVAHASDGGGSIRIPASCTGLFGLKLSRDRTPNGSFVTVQHVISRSVRDSAAMLDLLQGYGGDFHTPTENPIDPPKHPYLEDVYDGKDAIYNKTKNKDYKIAYSIFDTNPLTGEETPKDYLDAVNNVVTLLKELGYKVEEVEPPINFNELVEPAFKGLCAKTFEHISKITRKQDLELYTRFLAKLGESVSMNREGIPQPDPLFTNIIQKVQKFYNENEIDFYMMPTLGRMPFTIGETALSPDMESMIDGVVNNRQDQIVKALRKIKKQDSGFLEKLDKRIIGGSPPWNKFVLDNNLMLPEVKRVMSASPWAGLANLTGYPAMSIPLHWAENGLPVGIQFMAAYGKENLLFRLAGQLEEVFPWFDQVPNVSRYTMFLDK
ncbi:Asp-tRNAAsn/Glu-tRNAGln amidotransferase A subunit and related amidases [Candidatus Scalindua japonica]|uniref:Asp-tRNAAsn/Glu-tRNAGln amidotransferase A subunit and related amidases n=1 Tax=Candidatus Scalindua japonica TaxID=1284222 RepID=A0A286U250_9BACT|nr:amidase [Candidatus Scalindua japonica]GAX62219.1 Asp-tRNAAsn/Glu-tRNAGln amidotransferase A subunit and related amidases [Candidatus Scalindua japonica]